MSNFHFPVILKKCCTLQKAYEKLTAIRSEKWEEIDNIIQSQQMTLMGGEKGKAEIEPRMNHLLWIQVHCGFVKFIQEWIAFCNNKEKRKQKQYMWQYKQAFGC